MGVTSFESSHEINNYSEEKIKQEIIQQWDQLRFHQNKDYNGNGRGSGSSSAYSNNNSNNNNNNNVGGGGQSLLTRIDEIEYNDEEGKEAEEDIFDYGNGMSTDNNDDYPICFSQDSNYNSCNDSLASVDYFKSLLSEDFIVEKVCRVIYLFIFLFVCAQVCILLYIFL